MEASIEDLHYLSCRTTAEEPSGLIQTDAQGAGAEEARTTATTLEQKLDMELQYHKNGSYTYVVQPHSADPCQPDHAPLRSTSADQDQQPVMSSVRPATSEDSCFRPSAGLYESMVSSVSFAKSHHKSTGSSNPSLAEHQVFPPGQSSIYERQKSWPVYPVPDTAAPEHLTGLRFTPNMIGPLQDTGAEGRDLFSWFFLVSAAASGKY